MRFMSNHKRPFWMALREFPQMYLFVQYLAYEQESEEVCQGRHGWHV